VKNFTFSEKTSEIPISFKEKFEGLGKRYDLACKDYEEGNLYFLTYNKHLNSLHLIDELKNDLSVLSTRIKNSK
jgi:hypothetical protein